MPESASPDVVVSARGRLGHIRLSRPAKINALTTGMIAAVRAALDTWATADAVAAVLIDGAGDRGLCAGGDIAALYSGIRGSSPVPQGFWADEYRMNLTIAKYPKPVVSVMHGITFGGGIGIGGHASVRVVTESSLLAMPETAIGLSPDVGGLYLLARTPGEFGTHAALTGARIGPGDALAVGLADYFVPGVRIDELSAALGGIRNADDAVRVVSSFASAAPASVLWPAGRAWIDSCYRGSDARAILARLRAHPEPMARRAAATISEMSPTAVAVTLRAIRNAATMTLAEVLDQDLRLCVGFAAHHDLAEGIRARVVDKDREPRWDPPTLDDVTDADVEAFFHSRLS